MNNKYKVFFFGFCSLFIQSISYADPIPFMAPVPSPVINVQEPKPIPVLYIDTPTAFDEDNEPAWNILVQALYALAENPKKAHLILNIQGQGGSGAMETRVAQAIIYANENGAHVDARIIGDAYSAHAFLACAVEHVYFTKGSSLMFHTGGDEVPVFQLGSYAFGQYLDSRIETPGEKIDTQATLALCASKGLLSHQDLLDVGSGERVTVVGDNEGGHFSIPEAEHWSFTHNLLEVIVFLAGSLAILASGLLFIRYLLRQVLRVIRQECE